jgi:hypothetical protein
MAREITVTEQDLQAALTHKTNQVANLELQVMTLSRVLGETNEKLEQAEKRLTGLNGKEAADAESREEEVPLHD